MVVLGLAALLVAAVSLPHISMQRENRASVHVLAPSPVSLALVQTGTMRGAAFISNERVRLHWTGGPGTAIYRLQVATVPAFTRKPAQFRHPALTVIVFDNSYSLPVVGAQRYYWRVQVFVDGAWQRYSKTRHFTVQQPDAATPTLLTPRSGSVLRPGPVRLCWTRAPRAVGYELVMRPQAAHVLTDTCATVHLGPGSYAWSVAAFLQGARTYTGPYAQFARLTVAPLRKTLRARKTLPLPVRAPAAPPAPPARPPAVVPAAPAVPAPRVAVRSPVVRPLPYPVSHPVVRSAVRPYTRPAPPPSKSAPVQGGKAPGCIAFVNC